jgi:hypothetical protein
MTLNISSTDSAVRARWRAAERHRNNLIDVGADRGAEHAGRLPILSGANARNASATLPRGTARLHQRRTPRVILGTLIGGEIDFYPMAIAPGITSDRHASYFRSSLHTSARSSIGNVTKHLLGSTIPTFSMDLENSFHIR